MTIFSIYHGLGTRALHVTTDTWCHVLWETDSVLVPLHDVGWFVELPVFLSCRTCAGKRCEQRQITLVQVTPTDGFSASVGFSG